MNFRRSRSAYSSRSSRTSSKFSFVEGNFRIEEPVTPIIPEVHIRRRERPRSQQLTINEVPMMLLPKATLRNSVDFYNNYRRSACNIVADSNVHGLHISTIQSVNAIQMRTPSKSAMKHRCSSAMGRSDADSGIGSLKRSVTFDNLTQSRSTVYRSEDDLENLDNLSDISAEENDIHNNSVANEEDRDTFFRLPPLIKPDDSLPQHLDTFGLNEPTLSSPKTPVPPKSPNISETKRRKHSHSDGHEVDACEICGTVLTDEERVMRKFGKVDTFLDWVLSRWGKRRELQYIPRPSYVYRGHVPHFCNFVHKLQLHNKHLGSSDSAGFPDSELDDDIDLIAESIDGSLIGQWRKGSNASKRSDEMVPAPRLSDYKDETQGTGTEGRPGTPSSVDDGEKQEEEEEEVHSRPVTGIDVAIQINRDADNDETPQEIRITSSVQSNSSDKGSRSDVSKDNIKLSKGDASQISEENSTVPIPPKTPGDAWQNKNSYLSLGNIPTGGDESDENNNREPSPRQPPPSPEPLPITLPTTPKPPPAGRKRACITKKTKKPVERTRKMKAVDVPKEPDPPKEELQPIPPPVEESGKSDAKADIKIPDLPTPQEKKPREKTEKAKPQRHLIETQDEIDLFKPDATEVLNDQMKQKRTEIDWSAMDMNGTDDIKRPPQIRSWIQCRLALSQQSSRFELPMDMKLLENMSPQEYIKKYCIITSRRQNLYQKIFLKNKDKSGQILFKDIERSLKDVLVNTITTDQVQYLLDLLDIDEETKVDYKLFAGMAAYAERVLYPKYVTEDTIDMPEYQKEKIECADFCALDWKFHGVNVNPKMKTLLKAIS